jgi:hypothetical protein
MARRNLETFPNLTLRPEKPAKGNGGAQKHARWALWALGEANTREILDYTLPRLLELEPPKNHDYRTARRALESIGAVRVGRAAGRGRPWKWRLKDEVSSDEENDIKT